MTGFEESTTTMTPEELAIQAIADALKNGTPVDVGRELQKSGADALSDDEFRQMMRVF